jgi:hypothetical protein
MAGRCGCPGGSELHICLGAGVKAKSVTNPLIIPSVLGGRSNLNLLFTFL